MLIGAVEVGFSARKKFLPAPNVSYSSLDGEGYSDDYLFEGVDGPPKVPKKKLEPVPEEPEDIALPKGGGHKFAPTLKKR